MAGTGPTDVKVAAHAREPSVPSIAASLAHEINNPLDSLANLLYLVAVEVDLTEPGRHYLALAQEEVRRISQITREALNQDRIEQKRENADVCELLSAVLDFYKQRFESSGITVESHYFSHLHIPVYAGRLRQLFSNLLLNALEATPQGGKIHAHVSAGHERSGQQRTGVQVTVADNGSGIPQGMLSQIFERAFTMKPGGHGMGLALVKDVVKKHDGMLRVRSNTNSGRQGSVFSIFLPSA